MSHSTESVVVDGKEYKFHVVSGTVVGTDQRSDTHVYGHGSTVIRNGNGFGTTTIKSRVDIVRDLWLKDDDGHEHHLRFNRDVPLRAGQMIYHITLEGPGLAGRQKSINYFMYNKTTGESTLLCNENYMKPNGLLVILLPISFMLIFMYIGIVLLPLVSLLYYADQKKKRGIIEKINAARQSMTSHLYQVRTSVDQINASEGVPRLA